MPAASADESVAPRPTAKVHVSPVSAAGTPLSGEGFIVFRGPVTAKPVVLPTKLPGSAVAELPLGSQWTLVADFPGYFAASSTVQIPHEPSAGPLELQVTLRSAGTLMGRFIVDGKDKLPEGLEARYEAARAGGGGKRDLPPGMATCAVGPSGEWRCRLPAGKLDLALHPKGFVPLYLWNVEVEAGKTSSLGASKVQRGASVAGWIAHEDGTPAEKCTVRLEPATAPGRPNDPVLEFLRTVASRVSCQKDGFFQFSAVAVGSYSLVAEEKDARAQMSPVQVWQGAESRLTVPIVLRRPVDFEVTLSPPADWLGRPWRFEARRADEHKAGWEEPSFRAEASPEGRVTISRRAPGRFWITVYDRLGNAVFSDPHVDLTDPAVPYPITIDLLWIEGKIHLGDAPVEGRLFFGGRSGASSIEMTSDAKGSFSGPLPKPGMWKVDIEGDDPQVSASAKVEVKVKNGRAKIDLALPDTKVYGRVVDPSGKPAYGAEVTLTSTVSSKVSNADEKGEFEIRAFPEGTTEVSAARAGDGGREVSESYRFEASNHSPQGPVVLTLRRNRSIKGRILGPTGPVIGATISAWPVLGGDGTISTVRSGLDGGFELKVPEGTQTLRAVVSPPGGALKAYEVRAPNDAETLFEVEPSGGDVVVKLGKEDSADNPILAVWQDDIGIPFGTLVRWTEGHGVRFWQGREIHIAQLAPGNYTVCLGGAEIVAASELNAWKTRAKCASGYLASASVLDLSLH